MDGATLLSTPATFTSGGNLAVVVGLAYLDGSANPWRIHFDNVVVEGQ